MQNEVCVTNIQGTREVCVKFEAGLINQTVYDLFHATFAQQNKQCHLLTRFSEYRVESQWKLEEAVANNISADGINAKDS